MNYSPLKEKILAIDAEWSQRLSIADKPGALRFLSIIFAHSGDSWFLLLGLILLFWFGTETWKQLSIYLIIGIIITAVLVLLIKFTVKRKRPEGEWGNIYRKTDPHSFPSGHAARATMLAVLAVGFGPTWFGVLLAIWAPLVILARVAMGVHYISDVIAGTVLGLLIGCLMIWLFPLLPFLS